MVCPNCRKRALSFLEFVQHNPFKEFECRRCFATLKAGLFARLFLFVTFPGMLASFFYTFPILHEIVHSHPDKVVNFFMRMVVPYVVIVLQVVIIFLPVGIYMWVWGGLEVVSLTSRDDTRRPQ